VAGRLANVPDQLYRGFWLMKFLVACPNEDMRGMLIDLLHDGDLLVAFQKIALIYTDCVRPDPLRKLLP
jgi:hypothetical protein